MASAMLKLFILLICLNTFAYIGSSVSLSATDRNKHQAWDQDLFHLLLANSTAMYSGIDVYASTLNNTGNKSANISYNIIPGNLTLIPQPEVGTTATPTSGFTSFYDPIKIVWAFAITLFKVAAVPITIFTVQGLPPYIALIIGLPLLGGWLICIIGFLRGLIE